MAKKEYYLKKKRSQGPGEQLEIVFPGFPTAKQAYDQQQEYLKLLARRKIMEIQQKINILYNHVKQ